MDAEDLPVIAEAVSVRIRRVGISPQLDLQRRGEVVSLHVERSGAWQVEGVAAGKLTTPLAATPFTLVLSPLGSCAFDVRSDAAARAIKLDPLTCEVRGS